MANTHILETYINLKANTEYVLTLNSPANVAMVRNHDAAAIIYLSNAKVTTNVFDAVAMPGSWGSVAQPGNLREIHLISGSDINGVKVILMQSDSPGVFMGQMMKAVTGQVQVTATTGLKPGDLNLDATKDLQVDVKTLPKLSDAGFTWKKVVAAAAGDQQVKAGAGQVLALQSDAAEVVFLKDGAAQAWKSGNFILNQPLNCANSIVVNFAGAGAAWILYR
jgi:hypothetical protein